MFQSYRKRIQVIVHHVVTPRADEHLPHHHVQAERCSQTQLIEPPAHGDASEIVLFKAGEAEEDSFWAHMNPATNVSDSPAAPPPYAELVSPSHTDLPGDASFTS